MFFYKVLQFQLKKTTPLEELVLKGPEALQNWTYKQKKMW